MFVEELWIKNVLQVDGKQIDKTCLAGGGQFVTRVVDRGVSIYSVGYVTTGQK